MFGRSVEDPDGNQWEIFDRFPDSEPVSKGSVPLRKE